MARPNPSYFTNLLLRHNPKSILNPNHQFRNFGINGGEELLNQDQSISSQQKFTEVAKEVSRIIRTNPRWEQTLVSDFPTVNFLDSCFLNEVLKNQTNLLLSVRLLHWLNSRFGVVPEESCSLVFNALVKAEAAKAAMSFLKFTKYIPEPACLESYVRCLCGSEMIEEAIDVLDELKKMGTLPSLKTWNLALLASIKAGRADIVWKLYGEMIEFGVGSDDSTVGCLIQAFCLENNVTKGYEFLQHVLEAGYVPDNVAFNKLISGFVKCWNYRKISALLHVMITKNRYPDFDTYQKIIRGLCRGRMQRDINEAFRIFNNLKAKGYAPNRVMYTAMINGLCKMKLIGEAGKLWSEMIQKRIIPNKYTYNALINGLLLIGNVEEAHKLYKESCDRGYGEDIVSHNVMIKGLCMHGLMEEACDMFRHMQQKGVAPNVVTYNTLIQGFCREGKIYESVSFLYELLSKGLQPSAASYTVIIEKLCETRQVDEAKALWEDMQDRGVNPETCTNDFIIHGLIKEGDDAQGIEWLARMLEKELRPQIDTFEKLINIFLERDNMGDALLVLDYMFKIGYTLTGGISHSLVKKLCKNNSHHVETCIGGILERS